MVSSLVIFRGSFFPHHFLYDSLWHYLGWYLRTVGILEMDPLVHRYRWYWHRHRVYFVGASVCSKKAQA